MLKSPLLMVALVAIAGATLSAKPARADASVKVPFSFTVNGKRCPAGTYRVKGDAASTSVTLVGRRSSKMFTWVVAPMTGESDLKKVALQFDQEGSDHALRSIQYGPQTTLRLDKQEGQSDEVEDTARGGR